MPGGIIKTNRTPKQNYMNIYIYIYSIHTHAGVDMQTQNSFLPFSYILIFGVP